MARAPNPCFLTSTDTATAMGRSQPTVARDAQVSASGAGDQARSHGAEERHARHVSLPYSSYVGSVTWRAVASEASCERLVTPSFSKMWPTWTLAVPRR